MYYIYVVKIETFECFCVKKNLIKIITKIKVSGDNGAKFVSTSFFLLNLYFINDKTKH